MCGNNQGKKALLFVGAHPDDETFGVGGTLAQYAGYGVKVYYACATRGEAGSVSTEQLHGYTTLGEMRWAELECASRALGLAGIFHLGFRDSGMPGSMDNKHAEALISAPLDLVSQRIVKVIREVKPQVVVTFDSIGGYRHPDHIAIHNATVSAFYAAGNPARYPEVGHAYMPQKLYFHIMKRRLLRILIRILPFFGQNPSQFGRNKDIDLASLAKVDFPVHAIIRLASQSISAREKARACHASQLDEQRQAHLMRIASKLTDRSDLFMRACPAPDDRQREYDLFHGLG